MKVQREAGFFDAAFCLAGISGNAIGCEGLKGCAPGAHREDVSFKYWIDVRFSGQEGVNYGKQRKVLSDDGDCLYIR